MTFYGGGSSVEEPMVVAHVVGSSNLPLHPLKIKQIKRNSKMKRLFTIFILIISILFSACSTKPIYTSMEKWGGCTNYCVKEYCVKEVTIADTIDPNVSTTFTFVNKFCENRCLNDCIYHNSDIMKEWEGTKDTSSDIP